MNKNNIKFGYACINLSIDRKMQKWNYSQYTNAINKYGIDKANLMLVDKITNNLRYVLDCLEWNINNNIYMYRISSELIPLATHPNVNIDWKTDYNLLLCDKIKSFAVDNSIRLSFHPDTKSSVVFSNYKDNSKFDKCKVELNHHNELANILGVNDIIVHVGGKFDNKELATITAISNINSLSKDIKDKLLIENCENSWNIAEVIHICKMTSTKPCLDLHHYKFQPVKFDIKDLIELWGTNRPKVHLSSSKDINKLIKAHHDYISKDDLEEFVNLCSDKFDCMIEAKSKNLAVLNVLDIINDLNIHSINY